jgi:hypothetical protein
VRNVGGVRVEVDVSEYDRIVHSAAGPVAQYLYKLGALIVQEAKRRAPVGQPSKTPAGHPSGWLRSHVWWAAGRDGRTVTVDIGDDALTSKANPFPGEPYAAQIEGVEPRKRKPPPFARGDKPYVLPAVDAVFARENSAGR